jgi:type IV pilus assembly protein PilQ
MSQRRPALSADRSQSVRWPLALWAAVGGLVSVPSAQAYQPAGGEPAAAGEKAKVTVSPQDTVDIHVKDESIVNVLELLGVGSQRNIIVSKAVSGKVSADLYNVTFEEALNAILRANGLDYLQEGRFIYVYTAEEMAEMKKKMIKRQAKVLTMSYLNAADAAEFVKPLLSEGGEIKFVGKTADFNIPSNAPVGADNYALGATLVVIDYPENISAIEQVLVELDTKPKQVMVQATVLQTQLKEENAFGVDLSIIADLKFTDFLNIGGPLGAADGLVRGGDGTKSDGNGLSPPDNQGVAIGTSPGLTKGKSTLKIGVVGGNVSAFVRMLDEVSDTVVLSNPRLLTLNRQPARVLVGERVAYLSTTQTETSQTQTVQFLDTGVQLYVRPFVAPNNQIRLELKPQVSTATTRNIKAGGGEVTVPDETTQEIVTNVIVNDGMTIVLGGLFQEATVAGRRQVPVLGDIPLIGAAFRGHDDTTDRNELIFMITPTIMSDSSLLLQGFESMQTTERVRAGTRQGLLPWSRDRMTSVLNVEAEQLAREGQTDTALWKLQRSLSFNPRQPEALRLRERLTGEQEVWPDRSLMEEMLNDEVEKRLRQIPKPEGPVKHYNPYGSHDLPRQPAPEVPGQPGADAGGAVGGSNNGAAKNAEPNQGAGGGAPAGSAELSEASASPAASTLVEVRAEPVVTSAELAAQLAPQKLTVASSGSAVDQPAVEAAVAKPSAWTTAKPLAAAATATATAPVAEAPAAQAAAASAPAAVANTGRDGWQFFLSAGWSMPICLALPTAADEPVVVGVPTDGAE